MKQILELQHMNRRRYEHRGAQTVAPEFLNLLKQASAKTCATEDLAALFSQVVIENTSMAAKKPCTLRLSIARNNGNIFVNHNKKPIVEAYINPLTGLLVCEDDVRMDLDFDGTRDHIVFTPHHQFQMLGFAFAAKAIQDYVDELSSLSANELQALALKPLNQIIMELNQFFEDGTALYKNIAEELTHLHTPSVPQANQFMAFADDEEPRYLVTARVPYPNPIHHLDMDTRLVDRFLNVFFDDSDKAKFAWYMGAALRNIRVDDPSVSKMLMMSSAHAGSGKSTLVSSLVNALFTKSFGNINSDFDEHFDRDNRFSSESLVNTRMNVYLEAEFGRPTKDGNNHDFNNMKVSTIKTMITDGCMNTEEKYQARKSSRAFGLHIVLTNHPARITEETDALRRRILPCLVKATSMEEKARELGLFGQKKFEAWIEDHALEFAVYFVRHHLEHEYDYANHMYNSKSFIREVNHFRLGNMANLDPLALMERNRDNIFSVLEIAEKYYDVNLQSFIDAIEHTEKGVNYGPIRISGGMLYLDASQKTLRRFANTTETLRDILIELYGVPEKKYQMNRFTIPLEDGDLNDFLEARESIKRHEQERDEQPDVLMNVVDENGNDITLVELTDELKVELSDYAYKIEQKHINERVKVVKKREPLWKRHLVNKHESTDDGVFDNDGAFELNTNGSFKRLNPLVDPVRRNVVEETDNLSKEDLQSLVAQYEREMSKVRELMAKFANIEETKE